MSTKRYPDDIAAILDMTCPPRFIAYPMPPADDRILEDLPALRHVAVAVDLSWCPSFARTGRCNGCGRPRLDLLARPYADGSDRELERCAECWKQIEAIRRCPTCPECHAQVEREGMVCPTCESAAPK